MRRFFAQNFVRFLYIFQCFFSLVFVQKFRIQFHRLTKKLFFADFLIIFAFRNK